MKTTNIERIEVCANGVIQILLHKRESETATPENHRTVLEPGMDIDGTRDAVNQNLSQMGFPAVPDGDWQRVRKYADLTWTPEMVAEWDKKRAQARAEDEERQARAQQALAQSKAEAQANFDAAVAAAVAKVLEKKK